MKQRPHPRMLSGSVLSGSVLSGSVVCLLFLATAHITFAQAPRLISYQGQLTDTGGTPVPDANYSVVFGLYDVASSGTQLWTETHPSVATMGGVFSVTLGSITPFPTAFPSAFADSLWIGVKVGADPEMSPRGRLASAPYAMGLSLPVDAHGSESGQPVFRIVNDATSGFNYGIWGQTKSTAGTGVFGTGSSSVGLNYGVRGQSNSNSGFGLWGQVFATASPAGNAGVKALSATSGPSHAVWAVGQSATGMGLFVQNTAGGHAGWFSQKVRVVGDHEVYSGSTIVSLTDVSDESFKVYNAGVVTIELDADFNGDGRIITDEIEIQGGADLSEYFDLTPNAEFEDAGPGTVVSIDRDNPGKLLVSSQPYDKLVAGVISGAGEVETGLLMGQKGSIADGSTPIALVGRVFAKGDATVEPIRPGDLLTTSPIAGHVMRASDTGRAQGAVIGKAMSSLNDGTGLVLVLIALQ